MASKARLAHEEKELKQPLILLQFLTVMKSAYCTLLTKTSYLPGILVLHASLVAVKSKHPLVAFITRSLPSEARSILRRRNIIVKEVDSLLPKMARCAHVDDERFKDTWTKLRAFELTEYERVVLMDSDALVLRNMDELMELRLPGPDWIAAVHACTCNPRKFPHYPADWVPANCAHSASSYPSCLSSATEIRPDSPRTYGLLNSGLVVLNPSNVVMEGIVKFLDGNPSVKSFKFPDQDTLAEYFKGRWKPLPFIYNALKTLRESHRRIWCDEDIKYIHYILDDKPWKERPPREGRTEVQELNSWWWYRYDRMIEEMKAAPGSGWQLVQAQLPK